VTCIPDEVKEQIEGLLDRAASFLESTEGQEMNETMLMVQIQRLVANGHIPLPCSLTEAVRFLGTHDTTSLLQKGTDDR